MFDSKVKASDLIRIIKGEVDAAPSLPDDVYLRFIDETEQLLYSEIIKEIHVISVNAQDGGTYPLVRGKDFTRALSLPCQSGEKDADDIRFEDIHAVFAGGTQLIKAAATGRRFPDSYYKIGNDLYVKCDSISEDEPIEIYYYIRPALKSRKGGADDNINIPTEWLPIISSKLRGEAYKLVNEDYAAAKWLNDYNYLLEGFKTYMAKRASEFGEIR